MSNGRIAEMSMKCIRWHYRREGKEQRFPFAWYGKIKGSEEAGLRGCFRKYA
jgi:hypothetical protein